jgi:hypothetical protein
LPAHHGVRLPWACNKRHHTIRQTCYMLHGRSCCYCKLCERTQTASHN